MANQSIKVEKFKTLGLTDRHTERQKTRQSDKHFETIDLEPYK